MPAKCYSGVQLPADGRYIDTDHAYARAACGFVARASLYPYLSGQSRELQDQIDAHTRAVHPDRWAETVHARRMSAD
ncbi:MAG TPA: hypothetical protein VJ777_19255 [Mycobacterium sp.]|nr:hypothetical protein [Mycobacterium sp.]